MPRSENFDGTGAGTGATDAPPLLKGRQEFEYTALPLDPDPGTHFVIARAVAIAGDEALYEGEEIALPGREADHSTPPAGAGLRPAPAFGKPDVATRSGRQVMEDRELMIRSIANLWTFQAAFVGRLMLTLRQSGALSAEQAENMLQALDEDCQTLEGDDEQAYATGLLASARTVLAAHGYGSGPRGADD
ncbi:MAG TPA: hypothetical protein VFG14_04685 [Chthoniobacteraceae bacterium]|nr:hypothetical protein [Chthoniobacteraceae bacterium]